MMTVLVLLEGLLVQHGHVAADHHLDQGEADAEAAEGHAAALIIAIIIIIMLYYYYYYYHYYYYYYYHYYSISYGIISYHYTISLYHFILH